MSQNTDLAPGIPDAANTPISVTADGVTVAARPIDEQIRADRYAKAAQAVNHPLGKRGLRFTRLVGPPQCPTDPILEDLANTDGSFM